MTIELPADPNLATKVIEAQRTTQRIERGAMGWILGTATDKQPSNVAALAILLAFVGIAVVVLAPSSPDVPKRELLTGFISIITGALGFVFGHSSRKD